MNTDTLLAWYFAAVGGVLLIAQHVLMGNAHDEAVARLKSQHEKQLAAAAPAVVAAAEPATALTTTPPVPEAAATPAATAPAPAAAPARPLAKAELAALEPRRSPDLIPVAVTFRTEPFEKGRILMVSNKSGQRLACQIRVRRPSTGESQVIPATIAPAGELRVAGGKDWTFSSGDRIEIAHAAYQPLTAAIP